MSGRTANPSPTVFLYATILLAAAVLRVWRLSWGLGDDLWFPDELYWGLRAQAFIPISWESFWPHDLIYPTLYGYLTGFAAALANALGLLGAAPPDDVALNESLLARAAPSILVARSVSAAAGVMTVAVVGVLGRLLYGPRVGLAAAAFLAAAPLHVMQGHYASVDVLLAAGFALTLLATHVAAERGTLAGAFLAGASAGFTFAGKFTGLATLATVGLVILLRFARDRALARVILLGLAAAAGFAAAVSIACPPCVLQPDLVVAAADYHRAVATSPPLNYTITPRLGWHGYPYLYPVAAALPFGLGWPLAVLALIGVGMAVWRRERGDILLLALICPYFLVMGSFSMTCPRYLLPLFPALVLLAARVVQGSSGWSHVRAAVLAGVLAYSLALTVSQVSRFSYDQQQEIAGWISENVPVTREEGCVRVAVPHASPHDYHGYYQLKEPLRRQGLIYLPVLDGHWFDEAPEVFVLPDWYEIAIRRERHSEAAAAELKKLRNGESGYAEAGRWRSSYLQQGFYTWLDPAFAADAWQGETGFTVYLREQPLAPEQTPACNPRTKLRGQGKSPLIRDGVGVKPRTSRPAGSASPYRRGALHRRNSPSTPGFQLRGSRRDAREPTFRKVTEPGETVRLRNRRSSIDR